MPVSDGTSKMFTDLGIAGAALLVVLVLVIVVISLQWKNGKQYSSSIDKLCTRIDQLVTQNATYLVSNDKDQKEILRILAQIVATDADIQMRVVRIDDRTYSCVGLPQRDRDKEKERREQL